MSETSTPRVEAIDRALQLLVALADAGPEGAPLNELAESVGVNKSTAYRALSTLRLRGFASQDDATGFYSMGPIAFELGDRAFSPANLAQSLHPGLVALSRAADELVHLGVMSGDQVLYVDKVEPERAIRVWSAVGQRVPIASTSMGRALLAARNVSDQSLSGYLRDLPAPLSVSPERLRESVTEARACGYAIEHGENEPDVACIGTAIMRGRSAVAAVSITALAVRMTPARLHELSRLMVSELGPQLPRGLSLMPALTA
ncbi:MAG: IclR family transcriptional regulator [Propionibacteriaceae bacterium]